MCTEFAAPVLKIVNSLGWPLAESKPSASVDAAAVLLLQIGTDQKSVVRRQPVLFFCVINQVGAAPHIAWAHIQPACS
jgi:hypothetical protein